MGIKPYLSSCLLRTVGLMNKITNETGGCAPGKNCKVLLLWQVPDWEWAVMGPLVSCTQPYQQHFSSELSGWEGTLPSTPGAEGVGPHHWNQLLPGRFGALLWGHRTPGDRQPTQSVPTGEQCPEVRVTRTREWGQRHPSSAYHHASPASLTHLPSQVSTWPPGQQVSERLEGATFLQTHLH